MIIWSAVRVSSSDGLGVVDADIPGKVEGPGKADIVWETHVLYCND